MTSNYEKYNHYYSGLQLYTDVSYLADYVVYYFNLFVNKLANNEQITADEVCSMAAYLKKLGENISEDELSKKCELSYILCTKEIQHFFRVANVENNILFECISILKDKNNSNNKIYDTIISSSDIINDINIIINYLLYVDKNTIKDGHFYQHSFKLIVYLNELIDYVKIEDLINNKDFLSKYISGHINRIFEHIDCDSYFKTNIIYKLDERFKQYTKKKLSEIGINEPDLVINKNLVYLAVYGKLNRDSFILAKDNTMQSDNFMVMFSKYENAVKMAKELNLDTEQEHTTKLTLVIHDLVDFAYGNFKLQNSETNKVMRALVNYLVYNGRSTLEIYGHLSNVIDILYSISNPIENIGIIQLDNGKEIMVNKRKRYSKEYSLSLLPTINSIFLNLPIEFKDIIDEIIFEDERSIGDFYWEKEYKTCNFSSQATCDSFNRKIYIYSIFENQKMDINSFKTTIFHELGHAYDYTYAKAWGINEDYISDSTLWKDAMEKDLKFNQNSSVSHYGTRAPREDFAESISLYLTDPSLLSNFPHRLKLLQENIIINNLEQNSNHRSTSR